MKNLKPGQTMLAPMDPVVPCLWMPTRLCIRIRQDKKKIFYRGKTCKNICSRSDIRITEL